MSLRRFLARSRWDDERARELESYLAIETDDNLARGMTPDEARAAALQKLGNCARVREEIYRMNTIGWIDSLWRDLKYGARLLRLNPTFASVATLSLALGIGANTAMFELLDSMRMRALPVPHPEQLAEVRTTAGDDLKSGWFSGNTQSLTGPLWERLRDRQQAFSNLFAWSAADFQLSTGGESRMAQGVWVSGEFFDTLQVRPAAGRLITETDDRRGCARPAAVISDGFWRREYGASSSVVGQALTLDRHGYTIVGVTPPEFFGVEVGRTFDVAVPLCAEALTRGSRSALARPDAWFLGVMGRLKPGWSIERARAQLDSISPAMFRDTLPRYSPEDEKAYLAFRLGAFPGGTGVSLLRSSYESPLWLLLATTALVLMIACANLANLMLARAAAREREIAVRLALGGSRARIVRQLAAESVLIAAAGAGAGFLVAGWLAHGLVAALTTGSERVFIPLVGDSRVFAFLAGLATVACLVFGVMPALRVTVGSSAAIKLGSRLVTDSREGFSLRRVLVVGQVALCLVLVVAALLFVRSFRNLVTVDAGFTQRDVIVARVDFSGAHLSDDATRAASRQLLDRVRGLAGVIDAAQVRNVPVGGSFGNRRVVIDGVRRQENVNFNSVSDHYFSTMGTALLAGRDFDSRDRISSAPVAIVTQAFARVFFGGQNPIGRTFQTEEAPGTPRPVYEIVGLVRDSKYADLRDPFEPLMYIAVGQDPLASSTVRFVVRSGLPAGSVTPALAVAVRLVDPAIVVNFRTFASLLTDSLVRDRLLATLSTLFGGLAALIAVMGLYAVMSYSVARRRSEIGIRLALGAEPRGVVQTVMREATILLGIGMAIGSGLALAAGRGSGALLFGLAPNDPATLAAAIAGLALIATCASYVPARRASHLEPTEALRGD